VNPEQPPRQITDRHETGPVAGPEDSIADTADVATLVARLTLEEKVALLTGQDLWRTRPLPRIGLRSMVFSDGPVGVRGETWDERQPSLNLPSPTALAAAWDPLLAHRYGQVLAAEARGKGVDVVLAPTVNLHRSPLGGRHFEAYSEDPVLTADLGAALVAGLQESGVGACIKHYVANDFETERFTASTEVSERALRELYLRAFETPVVGAGAWCVMSAYNAVNGVTMSEHPLLTDPLKGEWGFDGVVVSDWMGVRSLAAAAGGQDLVMPGPDGPWGEALLAAVRQGLIPGGVLDDKVGRLLLLAARVGALDEPTPAGATGSPAAITPAAKREVACTVAAEGTVLIANDGLLPLDSAALRRVAVSGHNALLARTQGGGSATVLPEETAGPLAGLHAALPDTEVSYSLGAVVQEGVAGLPLDELTNPEADEPGVVVTFRDRQGGVLHREHRLSTDLVWFGGDAPIHDTDHLEVAFNWTPTVTGTVRLGFAAIGAGVLTVDGEPLVAGTGTLSTQRLGASPLAPPSLTGPLDVTAGEPRTVSARLTLATESLGAAGLLSIRVGLAADPGDGADLIAAAADEAATADVAVVVVGTNSDVESEGFDRTDLGLPGRQDDLVRAVAATGTPTVVVVNAGAPVLLPWRDEVAAVLVPYFGGQEMGHALAEVLLGYREPGGRLPTTWPAEDPPPVFDVTPANGRLAYTEDIHVGYRAWLRAGQRPAYPFGHGLGYTTWQMTGLEAQPPTLTGEGQVSLDLTNTGTQPGKQVVQVYLSRHVSAVDRPVRWLAGHAVVRTEPGTRQRVTIALPWRAFSHWEPGAGWVVEAGTFGVAAGTSVTDLPLHTTVALEPTEDG
jgi:beta-glucosidase